jgi:O-antigen ligase
MDPLSVFTKYVAVAVALSLIVRTRTQLLVVLAAIAIAAIYIAYASHGQILGARRQLSSDVMSGRISSEARTSGVFLNENQFGMFGVSAIVAGITLFLARPKVSTAALGIGSTVCGGYLAYYSGSRKAIIGIGLSALFIMWMGLQRRKRFRAIVLMAALTIGAAVALVIYNSPYSRRFNVHEESFQQRLLLLDQAASAWATSPFFGLGYHQFQKANILGLYSHSTPVEMLCTGGLVALALYAGLWWGIFKSLRFCLAAEKGKVGHNLLYGTACYLMIEGINSLFSVTIEGQLWLVVIACFCGYLRSRELVLRDSHAPEAQGRKHFGLRRAGIELRRQQTPALSDMPRPVVNRDQAHRVAS